MLAHPELELVALGSDSLAGSAAALDPRLGADVPAFVANDERSPAASSSSAASATNGRPRSNRPRARSSSISRVRTGWRSGSTRTGTASSTRARRRCPSGATRSRSSSAPGLPDREPGCYATAVLLALVPLRGSIDPAAGVVVDAKSGVSGAGRTLRPSSHATAVLENVSPYRIGSHQHAPSSSGSASRSASCRTCSRWRGLIATCYVRPAGDLRGSLEAAYATAAAVTVLPEGIAPELARPGHGRRRARGLHGPCPTGTGIVVCALDNLGKGAAGQAVQNANLALGLAETAGLRLSGVLV